VEAEMRFVEPKSMLDIVAGGRQVAKGKTLLEIFREGKL
jgi:hypothetical protein